MSVQILYVEDDLSLAFVTRDNLERAGFEIHHVDNGKMGLDAFTQSDFDLCLLDIMLSKMDGFHLAQEIRLQNQDIPIIFLTAKSLKEDRIKGFEIGADDYVLKPYSIEELILRIKVFLKRSHKSSLEIQSIQSIGAYQFDFKNLRLQHGSLSQKLTQREAELLFFLFQHKNSLVRREDILEKIWGENDYFFGRSMDVFISKLRKYLRADAALQIENIHGIGFRLKCPE